jgi:hypothetical protein
MNFTNLHKREARQLRALAILSTGLALILWAILQTI